MNEDGGKKFLQNTYTIDGRRRFLKFNSTNCIYPGRPFESKVDWCEEHEGSKGKGV